MILLGAVTIFPYLNVLAKAFNKGADTALGGVTVYPRAFTTDNILLILKDAAIGKAAAVTLLRVFTGTLMALIVQFTAAYAFTRKRLKGRMALLIFLIVPMYFNGGLIPIYILYSKIHLLNNFLVYIVPGAFSFFNMIVIRTYLYTIPESLEESAKLDGANDLTVLARIHLPLAMPIIATITLWTAVGHWNDWTTTLYFITRPRLFTLQYIMMQMIKENERLASMIEEAIKAGHGSVNLQLDTKTTPEAIKSAQIIVTTIPIILVYPFLQKYFIKGVMIGAIKD